MNKDQLKNFVAESNFLKGIKVTEDEESSVTFIAGWTAINRKKVELVLAFTENFPNEKPTIILKNLSTFGLLPHVSPEGIVCFLDDEGLVLNEENPRGIIYESLEYALTTLRSSITGENKLDFFKEFDAYFDYFDNSGVVNSILPIKGKIKKIKAISAGNEIWLGENQKQLNDYLQKTNKQGEATKALRDFIFIPLKGNRLENIPLPKAKSFWTLPQLRSLIYKNVEGNRYELRRILKQNPSASIILSLPLIDNSHILIGLLFKNVNKGKKHPLIDIKSKTKLTPLKINRMDENYLLGRGGSNAEISNKKALIIGCGSIGGVVALELAKAGVLNLVLADHDKFSKDNLYRHVLGQNSGLGKEKVKSLKDEIEEKLPLTNVRAIPEKIQTLFESKELDFSCL